MSTVTAKRTASRPAASSRTAPWLRPSSPSMDIKTPSSSLWRYQVRVGWGKWGKIEERNEGIGHFTGLGMLKVRL